jgi:tyrosine aminotransferase
MKPDDKISQTAAIPIKVGGGAHRNQHETVVDDDQETLLANGFELEPQEARQPSFLKVLNDGVLLGTSVPDYLGTQISVDVSYDGGISPPLKVARTSKSWGAMAPSRHAMETVNPIRRIVDVMSIKPNPEKALLKLHLGDPTLTGTMPTHEVVLKALEDSLKSGKYNGYGPAIGVLEVRAAVAEHATSSEAPVTAEDVILTSGCSHALQLAIEVLANPGDNILVPRPGFPLYGTLMRPHGIEDRPYDLQINRGWEADLVQMEGLIDERTKAIIVNNPSNPCGAVFSKEHLEAILRIADRYKVPIIADEIYGDLAFDGAKFLPMATLEPKVPILTCDGIGKRYLIPGWRLGWLIVHDRHSVFAEVRNGLRQLAQKIVGPSAVVQGALPAILKQTPESFHGHTRSILSQNAKVATEELAGVPGLRPVTPRGAMYMMVGLDMLSFPEFDDELEFTKALIAEESVYCLPGTAFHYPGAIRLVMTYNAEIMREACQRIAEFCRRHYRLPTPKPDDDLQEFAHKKPLENPRLVYDLLADEPETPPAPIVITAKKL